MSKGVIWGIAAGTVFAVGSLGALSLIAPQPVRLAEDADICDTDTPVPMEQDGDMSHEDMSAKEMADMAGPGADDPKGMADPDAGGQMAAMAPEDAGGEPPVPAAPAQTPPEPMPPESVADAPVVVPNDAPTQTPDPSTGAGDAAAQPVPPEPAPELAPPSVDVVEAPALDDPAGTPAPGLPPAPVADPPVAPGQVSAPGTGQPDAGPQPSPPQRAPRARAQAPTPPLSPPAPDGPDGDVVASLVPAPIPPVGTRPGAPPAAPAAVPSPAIDATPAQPRPAPAPAPAPAAVPQPLPEPVPAPQVPDQDAGPSRAVVPEAAPEAGPESGPGATDRVLPRVRTLPEVAPDQPRIATAPSLDDGAATRIAAPGAKTLRPPVRTGRLPSIGAEVEVPEPDAAALPGDATSRLEQFATFFSDDSDRPRLAVLLVDDGRARIDPASVAGLGFPATVVLPASGPDAVDTMRAYRTAGVEVALMLDGLPARAQPQDVAVTLGSYIDRMDQAVAVVDQPSEGIQTRRPLVQQAVAMAQEAGMGLVSYDRGLNAARQIAAGAGLANASVARVIDAQSESDKTMLRYLDRAAFDAAQSGSGVVMGHVTPATLSALRDWSAGGKADSVALAPLSAVLLGR